MARTPTSRERSTRLRIGLVAATAVIGAGMVTTVVNGLRLDMALTEQLARCGALAVFAFVGVVVLWQRPGHGIGRLALIIALMLAISTLLATWLEIANPRWGVARVLRSIAEVSSSTLFSVATVAGCLILIVWFPDGRRTSRLGLVVEILVAGIALAVTIDAAGQQLLARFDLPAPVVALIELAPAGFGLIVAALLIAPLDLVLRYRRADAVRRTQIRWVLTAALSTVVSMVLLSLTGDAIPGLFDLWYLSITLPAVAIAIGITRYHLYDIDRIVSRTVSWAIVTSLLVATFGIGVFGLQSLLAGVFQGDTLAVAASTLVAFALFQPVRGAVQSRVDRRFDRSRYDGDRLLADFSERLRHEVDLSIIRHDARATVDAAVRPSSVEVWLRQGPAGP